MRKNGSMAAFIYKGTKKKRKKKKQAFICVRNVTQVPCAVPSM